MLQKAGKLKKKQKREPWYETGWLISMARNGLTHHKWVDPYRTKAPIYFIAFQHSATNAIECGKAW